MPKEKDPNKQWQEKITRAKAARKEWADLFRVDLAKDYFLGKQNPGFPEDEWITINKFNSHLQAQLPTLYSVDPYFYIKPKRTHQIAEMDDKQLGEKVADFERRGKIRQSMLNYLKGELDLKTKARMGILQAHFSYGAMKIRHAADMKENPKAGEALTDSDGNDLLNEEGEVIKAPDVIPVNKRYELDWVNSEDILWDEDAGPLSDSWTWIGQRIRVPKEEALNNKRYKRSVIQKIKGRKEEEKKGFGEAVKRTVRSITGQADQREEVEIITFWEIYHIKKKEWLTVAEDSEDFVVEPDSLPKGIEGHPFAFLRFSLLDDSPYPYPPMSPGIDPQREFNLTRSRMLTHRKRFNRKYEVVTNMLMDETEISKLEVGEDGTAVQVQALGAINPIKDAPLDQQTTVQEIALLNNELTELLGAPAQARGIGDADSATEASILDARLEVKEGDRMAAVTQFVLDAAKKLDALVQTHISEDEAVRITGPQGELWVRVRQEDYEQIEGEYEYTVNVGASRPRLPDIERSQWLAFLSQVVVPLPHILTMPSVMKRVAAMFHIEDEAALEEFRQMGLKILKGQVPPPGNTGGSQPAENNPAASTLGAALGNLGGNANGGGAQL